MQTAETEVQLCHWRWIPDQVNRYVWTQDPEFRRSKGGGGIVVARVARYPTKTKREGVRLFVVRPQWRHGQYGFWINGKHMVNGKVRFGRHMTETEVTFLAQDMLPEDTDPDGFMAFTSVANLSGEGVLQRVKSDCRDLGGKRIEVTATWNGKPDDMTLAIMRNAEKCRFQSMNGSNRYVFYRIVGTYRKKPFGDVKNLCVCRKGCAFWNEIVPDVPGPEGRYALNLPTGTVRLTFEEIVRGIE